MTKMPADKELSEAMLKFWDENWRKFDDALTAVDARHENEEAMKPTAKERKLAETWWSRGFDAGVADERERAKALVEALEKILRPGMQPDLTTLEVYSEAQKTAFFALEAFNRALAEMEGVK